ncbi:hypothetical protein GGH99_007482, partial [Coemansia sp. RSA 1285]
MRLCRFVSTDPSVKEVKVVRHTGADAGIITLALDRPKAKNALSRSLVTEFRSALDEIRSDQHARVVIVQSLVPGVFCAGADLKERATMTPAEVEQFLYSVKMAFKEL